MLTPGSVERDPVALLRQQSRSLVQRLRLWTPARYAAAADPFPTRGALVHHLAQALADTAAKLEGAPPRPVPRLGTDLALADQLAVTADDLVRAAPTARQAVEATCHLLLHRHALLGDPVPPALADALAPGRGEAGVLAAGTAVCRAISEGPAGTGARAGC